MKKTLKSILAVMLALAMVFCSATAFAATEGDVIEWDRYDDGDIYCYTYAGEITEGKVVITPDDIADGNYLFFEFTAEKAGYYAVTYDNWYTSISLPERIEGSKAYGNLDYIFRENGRLSCTKLYKLDAGEGVVFVEAYGVPDEGTGFSAEYLGESVTGLEFIDNSGSDLVLNNDIYSYNDVDCLAEFSASFSVTFSEGKVMEFNDRWVTCQYENELKTGENNVLIDFFGAKIPAVITVLEITDLVKAAEISNADKYLNVVEYYNGYYETPVIEDETVTVTLADGSTKTCKIRSDSWNSITLNGREYDVYVYYDINPDTDEMEMLVTVGGEVFKAYTCEVKEASLDENSSTAKNSLANAINNASYYFRQAIINLLDYRDAEDFVENLDWVGYYLQRSFNAFTSVFSNIFVFISHVFGSAF